MLILRIIITGLCFAAGVYLFTEPLLAQRSLDIKHYGLNEGLSHRDVMFTTRDERGFLWIVNSDIDFFDGHSFMSFNKFNKERYIPTSGIRAACLLGDTLLVFSDGSDLHALNIRSGKVQAMPYPENMPGNFTNLIAISDRQHHENILVFTRQAGITRVNVISRDWEYLFHYELESDSPLKLEILRAHANTDNNTLWIIDQYNERLIRVRIDSTTYIPFPFPKRPDIEDFRIIGKPGYGLVITGHNGVVYGVPDGSDTIRFLRRISFNEEEMPTMHIGMDGMVWVMSDSLIVKFDINSQAETVFPARIYGNFEPMVYNSYEDEEGIIWLSTEIGLVQVQEDSNPFIAFLRQPEGSRKLQFRDILNAGENAVYARILHNKRSIIEITTNDYARFDSVVWLDNVHGSGLYHDYKNDIYTIWAGSKELRKYHKADFKYSVLELPDSATTQFYNQFIIDADGNVIYQNLENDISVFSITTGKVDYIDLEDDELLLRSPWRVMRLSESGILFIGTETNGIFMFDFANGKLLKRYHASGDEPISGDYINALIVDTDTTLWAGTIGGGINYINFKRDSIKVFTTNEGLPNNIVASLLEDDNGDIWVGTYGGLSMYDKSQEVFYNYTVADGISDNEFNYLSSYKDENGRIYMGTWNGITIFHPDEFQSVESLPPVKLTRVTRYNRRTDTRTVQENFRGTIGIIEVSPFDNYVELEFAIPSYKSNMSHTYKSKLLGIDGNWQDLGKRNVLRYQKLPPGRYTLELMGLDAKGNQTASATSIVFNVKQIFYKSVWFVFLISAVLIGLVVAFYRYRLQLVRKEHATRTRIASDLHDEVGGSLTGLSLQLQMMELSASESQKPHLNKVSTIINESIAKMRDLVWSIDSRSDTWAKVLERMEDYASDILSPSEVRFRFEQKGIKVDENIHPRLKHNLYLIYKEAIHNIAKHSNATEAYILLEYNSKGLLLRIHDNGTKQKGMPIMVKGQGLENMIMRAERLDGNLRAGFDDTGYIVELNIPYIR